MERPVTSVKPQHLICGSAWALLLAVVCFYFGYRAYANISAGDYQWAHNWWDTVTWLVWVALAAGLISETRCWRERILFLVLILQFLLGLTFSFWSSASFDVVRHARWISLALWCLAALLSAFLVASRSYKNDAKPPDVPERATIA
jgi:hypothetical protein